MRGEEFPQHSVSPALVHHAESSMVALGSFALWPVVSRFWLSFEEGANPVLSPQLLNTKAKRR